MLGCRSREKTARNTVRALPVCVNNFLRKKSYQRGKACLKSYTIVQDLFIWKIWKILIFLSGTPCKNRPKKKVDFRFFYFFFIFMKVRVKKSLSLVGKKIKSFVLKDVGETRKKRFLDLFWWIYIMKNNFFYQTYFFEKLDMYTKNYNLRMYNGSKTAKIDFFASEFFVGILQLFFIFFVFISTN